MIRQFTNSDYSILKSWWEKHKEPHPTLEYLPESTFILEDNGVPVYSISVILTNNPLCYLEYFNSNPDHTENRKELSQRLFDYAIDFAKSKGHKFVATLAYREKVKNRVVELGMQRTFDNLSSFVKEL